MWPITALTAQCLITWPNIVESNRKAGVYRDTAIADNSAGAGKLKT